MGIEDRRGVQRTDPFLDARTELEAMREKKKRITGVGIFGVLEQMYQARANKVDPHAQIPEEFTFPGSNGEVTVERIVPAGRGSEAYNAYFVDSEGNERGVAVVRYVNPEWRTYYRNQVGISSLNLETGKPEAYINSEHKADLKDIRQDLKDLPGELLTALNYLHKPSRGQVTRVKNS